MIKKTSWSSPGPDSPTPLGGQITADSTHVTTTAPGSAPSQAPVGTSRGPFCEGQQVGTPVLPMHCCNSRGGGGTSRCSQTDLGLPDGRLFRQQDRMWLASTTSPSTLTCPPPLLAPTSRKTALPFLPLFFGHPFPSAPDISLFFSLLT